jgi:hypothetical protein
MFTCHWLISGSYFRNHGRALQRFFGITPQSQGVIRGLLRNVILFLNDLRVLGGQYFFNDWNRIIP